MNSNQLKGTELELIKTDLQKKSDIREFKIELQQYVEMTEKSPEDDWIKLHPFDKMEIRDEKGNKKTVPVRYIPIDVLETQLNKYSFGLWNWKVKDVRREINEILVYGDLEVFHPVAGIWITRSGTGASQIRMTKGAELSDPNGKIKTALQMDFPHAEAEAFKNACQKFGRIFGRGLRRDFTQQYTGFNLQSIPDLTDKENESLEKLELELRDFTNTDELIKKKDTLLKDFKGNTKKIADKLIQTRYDEIGGA